MARWVKRIAGRAFEENRPRPRQPDELLGSRQDQARFYAALETLSDKKREVFVLVNLEGVSSEEVASALGIPVATVWTRLHHARKALRAALDDTPKEARNPRDEQG
jgi:RNA polymerase sigma-70 factor (ECF subfamily)